MELQNFRAIDIRNRFAALGEPGGKSVAIKTSGSQDTDNDAHIQSHEDTRQDRDEAAGPVRADLTEEEKALVIAQAEEVLAAVSRQQKARDEREAHEEARVRALEARLGELNAQGRPALIAKLRARKRR